ncbi:hypothetical protein B0H14DRAFT_3668659 [Mycena olivaceomarginata]|nr:hypothetical protein B0H14DRAFT_3668659 [Mycena olivaceomarginata]
MLSRATAIREVLVGCGGAFPEPFCSLYALTAPPVATSAALRVPCGKYLAVITDPDEDRLVAGYISSYFAMQDWVAVPDSTGFEDCVIKTGKIFVFQAVQDKSDTMRHDTNEQSDVDYARRLATKAAAREADNVPDDVSQWTTFSGNKTCVLAPPGQNFAPDWASGLISYDISSLEEVLPASRCFEDAQDKSWLLLKARFSRPETERTIICNMIQGTSPSLDPPIEQPITNLTAFALDLCVSFDRPESPDRQATSEPPDNDDDDSDDDWISTRRVGPKPTLQPPAPFDTYGLQILYFDMYGTLIVRFQSRLTKKYTNHNNRTTNREYSTLYGHFLPGLFILDQHEALAFYFESEMVVKQRISSAPYSEILSQFKAYTDMATHLQWRARHPRSLTVSCVRNLKPWIPVLVALSDVDHDTLCKTSFFSALAPYFSEVFTWDASQAYRPDSAAFDPPLKYHDTLGVRRERRCLVSNSLLRDLEPARQLGVPTIWMRHPKSLAVTLRRWSIRVPGQTVRISTIWSSPS